METEVHSEASREGIDLGADCMLAFQNGDDEAFVSIVEEFQRPLLAFIFRIVRDEALSEDIAQAVFLRVFRSRESYKHSAKFTTWLFRIAYNLCLNASRDRGKLPKNFTSIEAAGGENSVEFEDRKQLTPLEALERRDAREEIQSALLCLDERQRAAIALTKFEGHSYEDSAAVLALTVPAFKSLLFRAVQNLKKILEAKN
ncbi:MAG: RNA polymerase sigma factor [Planctomycetes bacterium]|nr:RNA polymerase sigma factor [Planctomycetota bacterium]